MDRWGLGYEALKAIKSDIIYAQQSGMGSRGEYGRYRAVGPIAAALAGVCRRCRGCRSLPCPRAGVIPTWTGSAPTASPPPCSPRCTIATRRAGVSGSTRPRPSRGSHLRRRDPGLVGQHRAWRRTGNASPTGAAAPHGVYPCAGEDRWLAVACETEGRVERAGQGDRAAGRRAGPVRRAGRAGWRYAAEVDAWVTRWTVGRESLRRDVRAAGRRGARRGGARTRRTAARPIRSSRTSAG